MQDMYVPLLLAAGELSLLDLVKYIQLHIIANEQSWLHENIIHVFHIVTHSTTFSLLANHCSELICEIPSLLFNTPSFTRLEKLSLFFQIPGDQLYEFVWPFKKILPKQLKSQLIKFHMIPNSELPSCDSNFNLSLRVPKYKIDSLYISARHAGILRSWMNKGSKSEIKKKDVVEFKLLLRGSKDGMDVKTFHKLCDNKDVSENLKNNKSDNFKVRRFSTSNIINNTTITSVQNSQYAIRDMSCKYNNLGFGHDLWWFSGSCTQQYYGKRILPITYAGTFVMEDYEVFQKKF
ncbi:20703_t:CDS:2 [Rhizophagus irregularis]|nr:20703_t:CDS:2 [Rhizophagus irregularis]